MKSHNTKTWKDCHSLFDKINSTDTWYQKTWEAIYFPIYRFYFNIWEKIGPRAIKHYYQRARYGYSYRDCWSIDWHLAGIIPKMIRSMKKNLNGHPHGITEKEWGAILDTIASAFELEYEILDSVLYDCSTKKQEDHMKKLMKDNDSFEGCRIMTKKEKKTRDEGWKLFRKYFHTLWD